MKRGWLGVLWAVVLGILGACASSTGDPHGTLVANHSLLGTQVADLRISATVQQARAQTTVDFMTTRSALEATRSYFLEATLINNGASIDALATFHAQIIQIPPTATASPTTDSNSVPNLLNTNPTLAISPTPTRPRVTPFSMLTPTLAIETPPPAGSRVALESIRTALGAGGDDCGSGFTTQFLTSHTAIYIIIDILSAPPQTQFGTRWYFEGNPTGAEFTYTPDFAIENACIWFFADQTDFPFSVGTYSVEFTINGEPASAPLSFSIAQG